MLFISVFQKVNFLTETWINFWGGYVGAIFSIIGSFFVMKSQLEEEKKLNLERTRPIPIFGQDILFSYGMDSVLREDEYKYPLIRLINGGTSPLLNIKISYKISNNSLEQFRESGAINIYTNDYLFSDILGMRFLRKKVISIIAMEDKSEFFLYDELLMKLILLHYKESINPGYEDFIIDLNLSYEDNIGNYFNHSYKVIMKFEEILSTDKLEIKLVRGRINIELNN